MKPLRALAFLILAAVSIPAKAGPPYLTDDPVPTDLAHWELNAFTAADGHRGVFDGAAGVDINYGGLKDVQLTATVPLGVSRDQAGTLHSGTGDLELAVKYRFVHDEKSGVSAAIFPRAILPSSTLDHDERTRLLLPVWVQRDFAGGTTLFGGGGYAINPGTGNRNFWQAGAALTQELDDRISVGAELIRQGSGSVGAPRQTSAGIGAIVNLSDRYSLLTSVGPTWRNHRANYHVYVALGVNY